MKKVFFLLLFIVVILFLGYKIFSVIETSKPAMSFPEELERNGCLGLNYHRVRDEEVIYKAFEKVTNSDELTKYNVYEDDFKQQIELLKDNGAVFLTPDEIRLAQKNMQFPEKCVWISFDDVDQSVYENAFPILEKNKIPFTLFVIAGHVGEDYGNLELASWKQLQRMVDSGLATVGSHTYNMHELAGENPVFFQKNTLSEFKEDLLLSKTTIEEQLTVEVKDFAYPFGNGRMDLAEIIKQSGFESSYILAPRTITPSNDRYWMNRILVNQDVFETVVIDWIK